VSEGKLHFADGAWHGSVEVIENVRLARDTYRVRIDAPKIGQSVLPGQFLMLRMGAGDDPLLGRPLAVYDVVEGPGGARQYVDVVYLVLGRMTSRLAQVRPGQRLEAWGPLGNGFQLREIEHLVMVAGGIGQTPFLALGAEALGQKRFGTPERTTPQIGRVTLCYGARTAELLAGVDDFRGLGIDVRVSTDDGSAGRKGLVTETLAEVITESGGRCHVVCCGPEPMMHAVAKLTGARGVSCEVSLETPMACGLGICFSCVARVRQADGSWDYRRTCVEGPVFDAQAIEF
jgi:dihydroorotate dehydrogenase electron transfer subunit